MDPAPMDPAPIDPAPIDPGPIETLPKGKDGPTAIAQCFKACDLPARACERACKSNDCDLAATCFHAEAECDLNCYKATVAGFRSSPPERCEQTCRVLDQRCRSRTCGNSAICSKERCAPVHDDCEKSCVGGGAKPR
jgi:hypothetical protein